VRIICISNVSVLHSNGGFINNHLIMDSPMTLGLTTICIMTLSIMSLSIVCHYAECQNDILAESEAEIFGGYKHSSLLLLSVKDNP